MSQFNSANLYDVSSSRTKIAAGKPQAPGPVVAWMQDAERRIQDANDLLAALSSSQGGTSLAWGKRGQLWSNTGTAGAVALYVDPDGNGADDQIATAATAKNISFATGGTATFKVGGAVDVNTTQSAVSILYAMPANVIGLGTCVHAFGLGTFSSGGTRQAQASLGTDNILTATLQATATRFASRLYVVRTGGTTSKFGIFFLSNRDDGNSAMVDSGTANNESFNAIRNIYVSPTVGVGTAEIQVVNTIF